VSDKYYIGRLAAVRIDDATKAKLLKGAKILVKNEAVVKADLDEYRAVVLIKTANPTWAVWWIDTRAWFDTLDAATKAAQGLSFAVDADAPGDDPIYQTWSAFTWTSAPTPVEIARAQGLVYNLDDKDDDDAKAQDHLRDLT
jgi:hypothetical protein